MTETYKIADKNIKISSLFSFVHIYCKDYRTEGEPDFTIEITDDDINVEQKKTQNQGCLGGWLEVFAVYRKIAEQMPKYDRFLIHGSAVAVDG